MSTEPYVPNEYTAKQMYVLQRQSMHNRISPDYGAEFDRFVAKIRADALREVANDIWHVDEKATPQGIASAIRVEADRIENGDDDD